MRRHTKRHDNEWKCTSPFQHKTSPSISWGWTIIACPRRQSSEAKKSRTSGGCFPRASRATETRREFWASGPTQIWMRYDGRWLYDEVGLDKPRAELATCNLWDKSVKAAWLQNISSLKSRQDHSLQDRRHKPDAKRKRSRTWATESRSSPSKSGTLHSGTKQTSDAGYSPPVVTRTEGHWKT